MADVCVTSEIYIFTTPDELRKLADKMEEQIKVTGWGDSCTVEI